MKRIFLVGAFFFLLMTLCGDPSRKAQANRPETLSTPLKLVFIHHSTGENWLADGNGNLGITLRDNNYFVSDTNYGWGAACPECGGCGSQIGDCTDIGHWYEWFNGANSAQYLTDLYAESDTHVGYSRLAVDPGGGNKIILFKSCFPNSNLGGDADDPAVIGNNPLRGQSAGSEYHTVTNAKGIYNDLLAYFATRPDKLFVVVTAPPLVTGATDAHSAANARAFNNWLVNDWLAGYAQRNVAVFDFYNVLTSNGGNSSINDVNWSTGNHHRWWNAAFQHLQTVDRNTSAYGSGGDSHPTAAGGQKASAEFAGWLNAVVRIWQTQGIVYDHRCYLPAVLH